MGGAARRRELRREYRDVLERLRGDRRAGIVQLAGHATLIAAVLISEGCQWTDVCTGYENDFFSPHANCCSARMEGVVIRRMIVVVGVGGCALVFGIVILVGAGEQTQSNGCGSSPSAAGQPALIQYYLEGAAWANLGAVGYAYLAAINRVESTFGSDDGPGTGVLSGNNGFGAAGPMQIGIGGASSDTWGGLVGSIPVSLAGGSSPPSVYNTVDAIYGAALYLARSGAPGNWPGAIFSYNHAGWYVQEVTNWAQSYMGPAGLARLAGDIARIEGGGQPSTLVALTSTTASSSSTVAPPAVDGPTGPTSASGARSATTAMSTIATIATPGGTGGCGTVNAQGYADPWAHSTGLTAMRIDMGVDYSASGAIDAVGDGTITYAAAQGTGWGPFSCSGGGGGAVVEQLSDGSERGKWIYITEGIVPTVSSGTTVMAGQSIGTFRGCIEMGGADGPGPAPRAGDLHQDAVSLGLSSDPGAYPTACGEDMNRLLVATGSVSGLQGSRIDGNAC